MNPTGSRRVITSELTTVEHSGLTINTLHDRDAAVYQITGGNETSTPGERSFLVICSMQGLVQNLPDGSYALEYDVLGGMSGMSIRSASVTVIGSAPYGNYSEEDALPISITCWLDTSIACEINTDAPDLTNGEHERLWGTFTAEDLTLDGSGYRDHMRLSVRLPASMPYNTEVRYESDLWKEPAGVGVVAVLTLLTFVMMWRFKFLDKEGWKWYEIREIIADFRQPAKEGEKEQGLRFSDKNINSAEELIGLAGAMTAVWIITGAVLMLSSLITALTIYGFAATDVGIFEYLAYGGMLGGIGAPFFLYAVLGIFISSWYGGQSLSKYGFLVAIPFAVWFFAGLVVCDGVLPNHQALGPTIASLLREVGIRISLEPLLPGWAYWVVMAVFITAFFLMGFARKNPKR